MNFLAGDIGGTKTLLSIFKWDGELVQLHGKKYVSNRLSTALILEVVTIHWLIFSLLSSVINLIAPVLSLIFPSSISLL